MKVIQSFLFHISFNDHFCLKKKKVKGKKIVSVNAFHWQQEFYGLLFRFHQIWNKNTMLSPYLHAYFFVINFSTSKFVILKFWRHPESKNIKCTFSLSCGQCAAIQTSASQRLVVWQRRGVSENIVFRLPVAVMTEPPFEPHAAAGHV